MTWLRASLTQNSKGLERIPKLNKRLAYDTERKKFMCHLPDRAGSSLRGGRDDLGFRCCPRTRRFAGFGHSAPGAPQLGH
jgi:hypothetical protein